MDSSAFLRRSAYRLRLATIVCTTLVAVSAALAALPALTGSDLAQVRLTGDPVSAALAAVLFAIGLWRLIKMLRRVEAGETFTSGTISDLRSFALFTSLAALASVLLPPLTSLASAYAQDKERATLTFDISGSDLIVVLSSALLFFVTRLLREAQRIADDNRQII